MFQRPVRAPAAAARGQQPGGVVAAFAATAGSCAANRRRWSAQCQAAGTQQGRDRQTRGTSTSSRSWSKGSSSDGGSSWYAGSGGGSGSGSADPLLRSIAQCSSARELHHLLWKHSAELGAREVAAALEAAAKRKLLQGAPGTAGDASAGSGGGGMGSSSALGLLLVQLADKYAPVMPAPCLSTAAWSLAALQLSPARPVMQRMHALAERHLVRFSPSQLCALLWAGGSLDPSTHSPLYMALAGLIRRGMTLALFTSHDLAALMWLCGREGGTAARDISLAVADECRARLQAYKEAGGGGSPSSVPRGRPRSAASSSSSSSSGQLPAVSVPPAPFTTGEAAMLLTGLAQQQLRVGGVVEPLLRQCEAQLGQAEANDVARIIISLGELMMQIAAEPMNALLARLYEHEEQLSPQQVASTLWACLRLGGPSAKPVGSKAASMALRHFAKQQAAYRAVDTIGLLWGVTHMQRAIPEDTLVAALQAVQPELSQCSTAGLVNLVWALGKNAELRCKIKARWLSQPAGAAAVTAAGLAVAELAQRAPEVQPADLAATAAALAVHPPLAAALPAASVAAVRDACAAAAADNSLLSFDVAQLATAASRLRWVERPFLDALACAIRQRINLALVTSEVFSQSVWALASLAPSRYGDLFASLASAYAAKMQHPARLPAHTAGFQAEERSTLLAAFAAVAQAQGLPRCTLQELLSSVSPTDLRHLPLTDAVPLLLLAAEARVPPESPVVQSCCKTLRRNFPRLSLPVLRQVHSALSRLMPGGDATLAAVEQLICMADREERDANQPTDSWAQPAADLQ